MHTYLNGPFVAVITGKSTINILLLLAMVLLLFIITSDSIWLASFDITGSMKQMQKWYINIIIVCVFVLLLESINIV